MLKASLFFALLIISLTASAQPSDRYLCESYRAVNSALNCSPDNYLIRFGYKYCVKYVLLENTYQPQTQRVLEKIRSCLVTQTINDTQLTCENSEARAMKHHLKCYLQAGFCSLPLSEKIKIGWAAKAEIRHQSFRATMRAVAAQCTL